MNAAEIENIITAHKLFRCKLNTHRMWTNAVRAIPILIATDTYLDIDIKDIAHMIIEDQHHVWSAVSTLDTWLNNSLNRHDANGRRYVCSETYIAVTDDIKLLWARIRDIPEATAYLTDSDTPLYIDIANMRVVQGECSVAGHDRIITTAQELGVLCYNAAGEVRALLHNAFADQNIWTHERIEAMYPRSEDIYKMYMSKLYRGGLCLCESQEQEEYVLPPTSHRHTSIRCAARDTLLLHLKFRTHILLMHVKISSIRAMLLLLTLNLKGLNHATISE